MKTSYLRTHDHTDHSDVERLYIIDGEEVWAVVHCGVKLLPAQEADMKYQVRFTNLSTPNHIQRETITAKNTDEIVSMMQATNCMVIEIIPQLDEQQAICDAMVDEVAPMLDRLRASVAGAYIVDDDGVDLQQASDWQDEAIALEADAQDWQNQITELRGG